MLEEHDLVEPNVTTARADTPQQCFKGLAEGRYDVVTLATDAYAYLKLLDELAQNEVIGRMVQHRASPSQRVPSGEQIVLNFDQRPKP